jgi:predicted lipoprotein with Yx(FWY)xxD motif
MKNHRNLLALLSLAVLPMLAACGSSTSTTSNASPSAVTADTSPTPSTAASSGASGTPLLQTATVTVAGQSMSVLTNDKGLTIYHRTSDTATSVTCTGSCATSWPPILLVTGAPTAAAEIVGNVTTLDDPNGKQLLYKGQPLYRFSGDKAPGDAKGQGIGGVWFAVTV